MFVAILSRNSLQVRNPWSIMSRIIGNHQGSPNISTEAFSGHPDRLLGLAFFLHMTPQ